MTEFTMLKKRITEEAEKNTADTAFYIENGYFPTWAEEHRTDPDRGLKANSTETRWKQYQAGTITREKAVELATKRATKEIEKKTAAKLAKLDRVAGSILATAALGAAAPARAPAPAGGTYGRG